MNSTELGNTSSKEIAAWIKSYPNHIATSLPERPQLPRLSPERAQTPWEKVAGFFTSTQEVIKLGQVVVDAQTLPRADFLKKWASTEQTAAKGYVQLHLPETFIAMVKQVVTDIPTTDQAGIDTSLPLSPEVRFIFDPTLIKEIYSRKDTNKGQLHLFLNSLRRTVFNSKDPVHLDLRKEIARFGSPRVTTAAITSEGSSLVSELTQVMEAAARTKHQVDLVNTLHTSSLKLFAYEYFPQLEMNEQQAAQVRKQPETVFGAGAAAQAMRKSFLWPIPARSLLERTYLKGTDSLNQVFAQAFQAYAQELNLKGFPEELRFIDYLVMTAYEHQSYSLLLNNVLSAVAAGTDTTTQVLLESMVGVIGNTEPARDRRAQIVEEFSQLHPALAEKLVQGDLDTLSPDEWKVLTNPDDCSPTLSQFVQTTADQSSPVALTFKSFMVDGQEITCLVPLALLANGKDQTAFGGQGSPSQCTGKSQALTTVSFFTLTQAFGEYEICLPKKLPTKKVGIVRTHGQYPVTFQRKK